MDDKITEALIQKAIYQKFNRPHRFLAVNIFLYNWESDFVSVTKAGFVNEYEIKISKADFLNEARNKQEKYLILTEGQVPTKYDWEKKKFGEFRTWKRPNMFWYVVPENLIKVEEINKDYGLIYYYFTGIFKHIEIIQKAQKIHKEKIAEEQKLKILESAYWKYWNMWLEQFRRKRENSN